MTEKKRSPLPPPPTHDLTPEDAHPAAQPPPTPPMPDEHTLPSGSSLDAIDAVPPPRRPLPAPPTHTFAGPSPLPTTEKRTPIDPFSQTHASFPPAPKSSLPEAFSQTHAPLPSAMSLDAVPSPNHSQRSDENFARYDAFRSAPPPTPPPSNDPLIGQNVAGRFVLQGLLGEGGMGKVYLAQQAGLERPVALKLLHAQIAGDDIRQERFRREAQAMTKFSHPGTVTIYDFGTWNGQFFIAMEYLHGSPLSDLIKDKAPLPLETIIDLLSQVCAVLQAAHQAKLVHRDLKPENIILQQQEQATHIKLVDFGLALLLEGDQQKRLTQEGMMLGTPAYIAPEQAQNQPIDHRADIYALGVIAYEMLVGSLPFLSDNVMSLMLQHLFAAPQPPSERKPELDIPPALEELILQAMAKNPADRPQSALAFQEVLTQLNSPDPFAQTQPLHANRDQRAAAVGIPSMPQTQDGIGSKLPPHNIIVFEEAKNNNMESIIVSLWSNGFKARPTEQISEIPAILEHAPPSQHTVLLVDLCPQPTTLLQQLHEDIQTDAPLIIVGPDDDFDIMNRALEIGAADYIPSSDLHKKLPKALRRIIRRLAKKSK